MNFLSKVRIGILGTLILALILSCSISASPEYSAQNRSNFNYQNDANMPDIPRLTGVNWFGFETEKYIAHGLWSRDYKSMIQQMKDLGFNCIRIPWCNDMLDKYPGDAIQVNAWGDDPYTGERGLNLDLEGLTSLEVLEKIIAEAERQGMRIILDNHSRMPDAYKEETLWYTPTFTEDQWIADWVFMINKFKMYKNVIAADINNEPHGGYIVPGLKPPATWGFDLEEYGITDWRGAAIRCSEAILAENPDMIVVIQGVQDYEGSNYWWGSNHAGLRDHPITTLPADKVLYSVHEYGPTVHPQDWFEDPTFPANLPDVWNDRFWFIRDQNIGDVYIGEIGLKEEMAADPTSIPYIWFTEFMKFAGDKVHFTYWSWNPNSGDTGGILKDDWLTVEPNKYNLVKPYLEPITDPEDITPPAIPTSLAANSISQSEIELSWEANTESDLSKYNIYRSSSTTGVKVLIDATTSNNFSDNSLSASTEYFYSITAEDFSGNESNKSLEVSAITHDADTIAPNAPSGLTVVSTGSSSITLSWDNNSESDLKNYNVYRSFNPISTIQDADLIGTIESNNYTDSGLFSLTTYYYSISAVDTSLNESVLSINVSETTQQTRSASISMNWSTTQSGNSSNTIGSLISISNNGEAEIDLSKISINYYFTKDSDVELNFWCDNAGGSINGNYVNFTENIEGTFLVATGLNTDTKVVISFNSLSPSLKKGETVDVNIRITKSDWSNFDQSNDYSFLTQNGITLYYDGNLITGIQP